jgi:hypothetical protein
MREFGYIQDSSMPSWKMKRITLTALKIKMQISGYEGETKTRWTDQVAEDTMYKTEYGKSGHKYNKGTSSRT